MGAVGESGGVNPSGPLLTMKLVPPVLASGSLPRPEVVERLAGAEAHVSVISAPAGWGKTSLLAEWIDAEKGRRPVAFLRLEEGDDTASLFWSYIVAALRRACPDLAAGAEAALRSPDVDPMREVVPSLLNELTEIDEDLLLVLDDYHVITDGGVHAAVSFFIEHLPASVHLAIASRSDPPLPLGRLRVSGELVEARAGDLAFTPMETAELLRRRFAVNLDEADSELLCRRTEGWPAAVQLAGLSLQGSTGHSEFVAHFAGDDRNVADYLIGEALSRVSDADREFLRRTSLLDQMTGPLCDEVAGVRGAAEILDRLERRGLFLVPLDNRREWYRYHRLFRDWLRHELRRVDAESIVDMHLSAADWYVENGSLEHAIDHAFEAGDHALAVELIDRYLEDWGHVHWSLLSRWLGRLPDDEIRGSPLTAMGRFHLALSRGDFQSGAQWIDAAEVARDVIPPEVRSEVETLMAIYRAFGELAAGDMDAARDAFEAITVEERPKRSPNHARAAGLAGIATFWTVGPLEAVPLLLEGKAARREASVNDGGVTALLALAYAEAGDLAAAEDAATDAFSLPEQAAWYRYPERMAAHFARGKVLVARGEREAGLEEIREGLGMARGWVEPIFVAYGCLALADAIGDYTEKRSLVREARQFIDGPQGRGRIVELVAASERKLALRRQAQRTAGTVSVEPLTERELEVLRLLRSDLSLREIANELYISHNTIKSYTQSIYRKLGVSSRSAALETAADLDLF